jgi:hypothetical protein
MTRMRTPEWPFINELQRMSIMARTVGTAMRGCAETRSVDDWK